MSATLDKNRKGFGFLIFDDRDLEDLFLPPHMVENFFHGDRLEVRLSPRDEVLGVRLVEHRFKQVIGRYVPHPQKPGSGWVSYENKKFSTEIFVKETPSQVKPGDWVKAKLVFDSKNPSKLSADILDSFGDSFPASEDIEMIMGEFGLEEEHPPKVMQDLERIDHQIPDSEIKRRKDLRDLPFITIDGEDARDFDDAIYVKKSGNEFELWVAIADVSYYVRPGSELDREAFHRGNSSYFPERALHMLPELLSANLCSLVPNQDRLAMTVCMVYGADGKMKSFQAYEAVFRSHRRATYTEIFKEWEENKENKNWEFAPHFELFKIIEKSRQERGSLEFEFPEAYVDVDDKGEPKSIEVVHRNEAHRLIETFMIAANEAVTQWVHKQKVPFIYRIHESPDEEKIANFLKMVGTHGIQSGGGGDISPKSLSKIMKRISGHEAAPLLSMLLLRSLKQAVYSPDHNIHYGLASDGYTHFTSPIRRYPDLIVHRIMKSLLQKVNKKDLITDEELKKFSEYCSYRERLSSDAEREIKRIKQVRIMKQHLGDEFDAKIIGMNDMGLFVQIDSPFVEGIIPKDSLEGDLFRFDPDKMIYIGRNKNGLFKMGQAVRVQAVKADLAKRRVEFLAI